MRFPSMQPAAVAALISTAIVAWGATSPYPGVGPTVPTIRAHVVHGEPPPNTTGVPSGGISVARDPLGGLNVSALVEASAAVEYDATLYIPRGRAELRGQSSRIESDAASKTYGVKKWRATIVLAEDVAVSDGELCLWLQTGDASPVLVGNCP